MSTIQNDNSEKVPLFSVIVPIYNADKYLERCIDSVLKQSFRNFELILIDDGSTDSSLTICKKYAMGDPRINVVHKKNEGVSLARQTGAEMSNGEYLIFVDSDDWIEKDMLMELCACPSVDIIHFGSITIGKNNKVINNYPIEPEGLYSKKQIETIIFPYLIQNDRAQYYCPSLWSHAFKRELFLENMIKDVSVVIGEDGACVIASLYNAQTYYCLNKCLYNYFYNDMSITKGGRVFPWDGPQLIFNHLENRIDSSQYDFKEQLARKLVHDIFNVSISRFYQDKSYKEIVIEQKRFLSQEKYQMAIQEARFSDMKAKMMSLALKHKFFLLMKHYSVLKQ